MKNKLLLIINILLLHSWASQAQSPFFNPTNNTENLHVNFKQPMPPEAAMLWKFSNVPVDYHNGLVNLSIPLYEVQAKGYTLPISLSYYSSGIKVSEVGPWTGCGWNLAAGGGVSREYNGGAIAAIDPEGCVIDNIANQVREVFNNYFTTRLEEGNNEVIYQSLEHVDNEPDRFTISLPGINASFALNENNLPVFETKQDIKVSYDHNLNGWIIIAPDGTKYICTDKDSSKSITNGSKVTFYTSNWKVSKIITVLADTISFTYNKENNIYYVLPAAHQVRYWSTGTGRAPDYMSCITVTNNNCDDATESYTHIHFFSHLLTNIHVASTKSDIDFDVSQRRFDCEDLYQAYALKNIQVKNTNNTLVKNIDFRYTYLTRTGFINNPITTNNNYRLLLDSLIINNSEKYQFTYNPGIDGLPPTLSHAQDENGFYNGKNSNNTFCKKLADYPQARTNSNPMLNINGVIRCDRTSDSLYAIAGLLKSVQYPTGGNTDLTYTYGGDPGAFLINTITDSGGQIRKYSYSNHQAFYNNEADIGFPVRYIMCGCLPAPDRLCPVMIYNSLYIASSYIIRCMTDHPEFDDVTEYIYNGDDLLSTSKYYYYNDVDIIQRWVGGTSDAYKVIESNKWKRNLLKKVEIKDKNGKLIKENIWDYLFENNGYEYEAYENLPVSSKPSVIDSINAIRLFPIYAIDLSGRGLSGLAFNYYPVVPYTIKTHYYDLVQKSTFISNISSSGVVDETKGVRSYTFYTYTPKNTLPSSNSTNDLISRTDKDWSWYYPLELESFDLKMKYRYSTDFDTISGSPSIVKSLLRRNMKNYIIEQQNLRYDKIVASQFYRYNDDGTLKYLYKAKLANPMSANEFIGLDEYGDLNANTDYELETTYEYDINRNLIQTQSRDGLITSYLWGYNYQYPIAEIKNATYAQVKTALGTDPETISASATPDMIKIDGLRKALPLSQITTYTYQPLIGITSKTDPRGVSTRYIYDKFGRLGVVKDNNLNTLGLYRYAYQNGSENSVTSSGLSPMTATIDANNTYSDTITVSKAIITGGSGNYVYSWYLKNSGGNVIQSVLNTNSQIFSFTVNPGSYTIECNVTDYLTGTTISSSPKSIICYCPIEVGQISAHYVCFDNGHYNINEKYRNSYNISVPIGGGSEDYKLVWKLYTNNNQNPFYTNTISHCYSDDVNLTYIIDTWRCETQPQIVEIQISDNNANRTIKITKELDN